MILDNLLVILDSREVQHLHLHARFLQDRGHLQDAQRHEHALVQQKNGRRRDQADSSDHRLLAQIFRKYSALRSHV